MWGGDCVVSVRAEPSVGGTLARPDRGSPWPPAPPHSSVAASGSDWRSHDWAVGRALVPFSIVGPGRGVVQVLTPWGALFVGRELVGQPVAGTQESRAPACLAPRPALEVPASETQGPQTPSSHSAQGHRALTSQACWP